MPTTAKRYRWTREKYDWVIETGGFGTEDRIELLDGDLWERPVQTPRHSATIGMACDALFRALSEGSFPRVRAPIALDDVSEPEPDVSVVVGAPDDYMHAHPATAQLLVEVADELSLDLDRGRQLAAYTRNGMPEYWLIDLTMTTLEVYREPSGQAFASKKILRHGDTITPLHAQGITIAVADILP